MRIELRSLTVALLLAFVVTGCASSAGLDADAGPRATDDVADEGGDLSDLEAAYWARQEEARSRYVQADVDFMMGMIGHHAQALVMSALAPDAGGGQAVQTLAARIANAQRDEIKTMQTWLRERGEPVPVYHIEGTILTIELEDADGGMASGMDHGEMSDGMDHGAMDHGSMDHSSMPGMLSQAQLDEMAAARGTEFDRLFLAYMIQHHGGAVTMVEELVSTDGAAQDEQAFKFASDVQVDQRTEIARMQRMLDALPD